jgi:hypothetical protein
MPDEDLIRAESVPVRAARRRVRDPRPGRRLHQLTQHDSHLRPYRHFGHNAWWISAALITGASLVLLWRGEFRRVTPPRRAG